MPCSSGGNVWRRIACCVGCSAPPRKPVSGMTSTIAIMYAVEIHVISWMLAPSSPRMFGSATLTIDESIVAMSEPNAIEIVTSHLFTGGALDVGAAMADDELSLTE